MLNNVFPEYGCIHCKSFCLSKANYHFCPMSFSRKRTRKHSIELALNYDQKQTMIMSRLWAQREA